jgi:hypothetical protein
MSARMLSRVARAAELGGEGVSVGVAELVRERWRGDLDDLVAGGEHGHARLAIDAHLGPTNGCEQGNLRRTQAAARIQQRFAGARLGGWRGDELAKRGGGSGDPFAVARGVLEHDHGIGAGRNGRAGHDLECFAASQLAQADIARPHFALDAQPPWRVFGAHRETVAERARERRVVAIGMGGLGEHAAAGGIERNFLDGAGGERGGDAINDALPGLAKVQGGHETILASQPGGWP